MGAMNWNRVLIGGVAAGIIVFLFDFLSYGFLLNDTVNAAYSAIGLDFESGGPADFLLFILTSLFVGLIAVWLYAAIRPRYGAGPRTAAIAGVVVWLLYIVMNVSLLKTVFPALIVSSLGVGIVEILVATQVGAYLYQE